MELREEAKTITIPHPPACIVRKGTESHLNEILTDAKNERDVNQ